jgi:hypothetical protein
VPPGHSLVRNRPASTPAPSRSLHKNHQTETMDKKTKTAQFEREKETKNTVKFAEVQTQGEAPIIGTLYVQKWIAGDAKSLKVTIELE